MQGSLIMGLSELKVAVLSGKGGTGKTFITVNLAAVAGPSTYVDCDVEEPNGHLFFKPEYATEEIVTVKMPVVDQRQCTGCRKCVDFCRFGALAYSNSGLMIFADICHSCGGCMLICPEGALSENEKPMGKVRKWVAENVHGLSGILNIGEPSGVPLIHELLSDMNDRPHPVFIDCPPGSACAVMESIKEADYCVLVSEPTLFGVHNLQIVWELVRLFKKPFGVVLNKVLPGEAMAESFCAERGMHILARIPFTQHLGLLNSQGSIAVREDEDTRAVFLDLLKAISKEVHCEATAHS